MKIIKSLALMLTIAVIAVGATQSFFGDTESSSGNTFAAGEIDLKVDNTTAYNGLVCQADKWTCEPWADFIVSENQGKRKDNSNVLPERSDVGSALGAAETTGSDSDSSPQPWTFYSLGFGGSVVVKFDNLIVNGAGMDLKVYEVTGGTYPMESATVEASQDGSSWTNLGTATRDEEFDLGSLEWAKYVRVTDTSIKGDHSNDADGYDLDAIKALHCGAEPNLVDQSCINMTWSEADLGIQKFFNFSDVKPGDVGEDTVSLHVYDNDAWGRLKINVTKDEDGTCTEPEQEAENNNCSDPDGQGELRENLDFMVWLDEGFIPGFQGKDKNGKMIDIAEGNNRLDQSEILLVNPGPIDEDGEEWLVADAIKASYAKNGAAPGITQDGHMIASTTYYFGLGWKLPTETGNDVQSDIFEGDIIFEVEQYRNNPNPFE